MKLKFTSLLLLAGTVLSTKAQVMISEDFTSPFSAAASGWVRTNNSASPNGTWAQGTGTVFAAFNGGANDYYSVNFASTSASTPATISNWLITPSVTLQNGGVLQFATRTTSNPASFPDRLEVYMSTGTGANVGTTPTSLGTFSTLLVSVNPSLTTTGYPGNWTVYTVTLSGIPSATAGRIGFRYFVTNGGASAAAVNSDYIGLDAVRYSVPCGATVKSYTVCSGTSVTLAAVGAVSPATYTWAPQTANTSSILVNPTSTAVYTLNYSENGAACPAVTSTVTIGGQLSVGVAASSNTVCAGSTVTLTATSAATNYSWSTGSTAPTITVAPQTTTTYSVGALNGFCLGGNVITVTAVARPTVTALSNSTLLCTTGASTSVTFTGNGASSYIWVLGANAVGGNSITLNINAPTPSVTTTQTLGLIGIDINGCTGTFIYSLSISPQPTLSVSSTTAVACTNTSVTITATGANTYAFSGAATSTSSPLVFATGATAGVKQFTVSGTSLAGCTATTAFSQSVAVCNSTSTTTGLNEVANYQETAVFPNPFSTEIQIRNLDGRAEVINAIGQVVLSANISGAASLKVVELPKGVYFVKTYNTSGELVKTAKLLKN